MGSEIFSAVIAVSIILLMLSFVVVVVIINYKQRQKIHVQEKDIMKEAFEEQLLLSQIEVQEGTYKHIAKELHDNIGQLLSTTKMLIGVTELKLGTVPDTLRTANVTVSKAIQELRSLSRSMDKEWLEQFNFMENLQSEIDRINALETVKAKIECEAAIEMQPDEQIILFRIVQEAMQNALRHAAPTFVNVSIQRNAELEVRVVNDGKALPENFHGMGTNNMRQRAQLFGGRVQWVSGEGVTEVTVYLPLNAPYED